MDIEARLFISLRTGTDRVAKVDIRSSRPLQAARVFHGKRVEDALKMLPLLFSVCGMAQACASARACKQALGRRPMAETEWNFHSQEVLANSLAALQSNDVRIERQTRLLINAVDPCVGYELSID